MKLKQNFFNNIQIILMVGLGLLWVIGYSSSQVNASQLNFSVEPILPENQYESGHTYFDLMVKPGVTQDLAVKMKNDTEKEITIVTEVNPATTNLNGVVEYGESEQKLDDTAKYNIKDLLKANNKEVNVPAKSEKTTVFSLDVPSDVFKGTIAGGITFKEKESDSVNKKKSDSKQGLAIENNYAYVVATILRESDEKLEPSLELVDVKPDQTNARNVIKATLKNPEARYLNKLSVKTVVKRKNSNTALYTTTKEDMQMAPNSSFDFPTKLEGEKLEAGDYKLELEAQSGEKKWDFTKDFTVTEKKAKTLNETDVTIQSDEHFSIYYVLIGIGVLVIVVLSSIFYFKKKSVK